MRTNLDNKKGWQWEDEIVMASEMKRKAIYVGDVYVGEIVYVRRRNRSGSQYGWRPAKVRANSKLTDVAGAVERLIEVAERRGLLNSEIQTETRV